MLMTHSGTKHSTPDTGRTPASRELLLIDGGTGSELRRRGLPLSAHCWSAVTDSGHARLLRSIHADFIAAGANVVTANTFSTSRFVLDAAGLGDRCIEINRLAITAARLAADAASERVLVAASLSCMPPGFDTRAYPEPAAELAAYRELCTCFVDEGVELILLEMMQHPSHAARACEAAAASGLPFWAGVSCRWSDAAVPGGERRRLTAFDDPNRNPASVIDAIVPFRPSGISIMHTPVDAMDAALAALRERWGGPTGAYAEIPYDEDPEVPSAERIGPDAYADAARGWLRFGLGLLGGCCGTTPAHIRALGRLRTDLPS